MVITSFILNKTKINIPCSNNDYMKDICSKLLRKINLKFNEIIFLYRGNKINQNYTFKEQLKKEDRKKNKITLFCIKINHTLKLKKKEIIKAKSGNKKEIISLEEYNKKSLKCQKNLCSSCQENLNKNHNLIELNNYICNIHNQKYNSYCNKCKKDLCLICENEHKKENSLIYYKDIITNINYEKKRMKLKFDKFYESIKQMNEILNEVNNKIKIYDKQYYNIIDNSNVNNINYQIINNINKVLCYNKKLLNEIDKINDEVQNDKKINYIINLYNKLTGKNKKIIKYAIKIEKKKVKIFGKHFVNNNKDNCKIIYEKKEYNLMEYFDINDYKDNKNILEIELKLINNLTDMSYMFDNCESLIYLANDWNTNEVKNMSCMFKDCLSLSNILDISEWDTSNVRSMSGMFYNCINLSNLPDISKWNTS